MQTARRVVGSRAAEDMSSVFARAILGAVRGELSLIQTWLAATDEHPKTGLPPPAAGAGTNGSNGGSGKSALRAVINTKIKNAITAKDTSLSLFAHDPINRKFKFKRDVRNSRLFTRWLLFVGIAYSLCFWFLVLSVLSQVRNSWGLDLITDDKQREDALHRYEVWTEQQLTMVNLMNL